MINYDDIEILDDKNVFIEFDDESYYIETTSVSKMNPEQKAKHEERKMHKTAIRNAEKMGFDPTREKRKKLASDINSVEYAKQRLAKDEELRKLYSDDDNWYIDLLEIDKQKLRQASEALNDSLMNKRKRTPKDRFEPSLFGTRLGHGSTIDASGRKHEYDTYVHDADGVTVEEKPRLTHGINTLKGKEDFDVAHHHEVGHMAQMDHGLYDDKLKSKDLERGKKSMGLAEDYAFKCAECFAEKYKSKLNDHDVDPRELHADYLSARKVGFNRVYKSIKQIYLKEAGPSWKTSGDYRALFIQDMMWLHKGRRDRCSMKYPEWTPEEKKAFMEFYTNEKLTGNDMLEMEIFREYMTLDDSET